MKQTVLIIVSPISVIPLKAGIQTQESSIPAGNLDSGFRRNDVKMFNKHHAANWTKR